MDLLRVLFLIAFAYLVGSVPTSYIAGRWLKGIDLRRHGSGTVSGTGVYYHVSRPAVVVVGVLDIAKVWLPPWLGLRLTVWASAAGTAGQGLALATISPGGPEWFVLHNRRCSSLFCLS